MSMTEGQKPTTFLWLEITGKCQLECGQCYAESGPDGTTGSMANTDWMRVISQAADAGVQMVQFIGGEPTTHPSLSTFIDYALARGMDVEVFTNLVGVTGRLLDSLDKPGVRLATSYYSGIPEEHDDITKMHRSHWLTTRHIRQVVERGIPLRVGIIELSPDQDIAGAYRLLEEAGVNMTQVGFDRLRAVGRGQTDDNVPTDLSQLCGNCGNGNAAVLPDGSVTPCVFSRSLQVGNVLTQPLGEVLVGVPFRDQRAELLDYFRVKFGSPCMPNPAGPDPCEPTSREDCAPGAEDCGPTSDSARAALGDPVRMPCQPDLSCGPMSNCAPADRGRSTLLTLTPPSVRGACTPNRCGPEYIDD